MIRIIVPIKQVPDMTQVKFDTVKGTVNRSSATAEINPFDLNALEAAVKLKEKLGGEVTVISMGPPSAEQSLKDAISRGADRAVLLTDTAFAGADTLATSYTLVGAVRKLGNYDLIICGEKTVDGDTGQVGPEIAEHLGIPHVSYVSRIEETNGNLSVTADMESETYTFLSGFPLLVTVTKDINFPRLPTFKDKMAARKAKIDVWTAKDLSDVADDSRFGKTGSPTWVNKITVPSEEGRKGKIYRNIDNDTVDEICLILEGFLNE